MQKFRLCFRRPEDITDFVQIVNQFEYDADLKSGKNIVDAKSLLGVIAISKADNVELIIHSEACEELVGKIKEYIRENRIA